MEELVGAASRRTVRGKWTARQRQRIVEASLVAGASINEVAERFGVRANLLSSWRSQHAEAIAASKRKATPATFAAVRVNAVSVDGTIEIDGEPTCSRARDCRCRDAARGVGGNPHLPRGVSVDICGQTETMKSSFVELGVGLVMVYLLTVVNVQSWVDAFIIITALPGWYLDGYTAIGG